VYFKVATTMGYLVEQKGKIVLGGRRHNGAPVA
jgi:hypothetical protein